MFQFVLLLIHICIYRFLIYDAMWESLQAVVKRLSTPSAGVQGKDAHEVM